MREIPLTQGQVALVDDEDFERLSVYKWYANRIGHTFYAARSSPKIYMHHEVMGEKSDTGYEVDHVNGDGLDNQRVNLRIATVSQNHMNQHHVRGTSRFKGVSWHSSTSKWQTSIYAGGEKRWLGRFASEEDAARAYDAAALEHFGEFARLNFAA